MKLTSAGLFCGIGGLCQGFERAGFKSSWATDFDPDVAQTYKHNFSDSTFILADLKDLDLNSLPPVDVLHAGFPCQSFSQAGNRKGFADERGRLFLTMMEKIAVMELKPSILVFENSPYIKVGEKGGWFSQVVNRIRLAGYRFSVANSFEIDARQHAGSPQSRIRLFMIAYRKDLGSFNPFHKLTLAADPIQLESLLDREKVTDKFYYLDPENKYSRRIKKLARNPEDKRVFHLRKTVVRVQEEGLCPTLTANMGGGGHNVPFILANGEVRKLTERECLRLQNFPESFRFPETVHKTARYRMIGNAVNAAVAFGIANSIYSVLRERKDESKLDIPA